MAEIKITGPDGSTFSFPVGTPAETIEGAMRSHYGGVRQPSAEPDKKPDERDTVIGRVDAAFRGAADTLTLGLMDEIAASLNTGSLGGLNKGLWGDYEMEVKRQRGIDASDAENRQGYRVAGQLGGGIAGGLGLAQAGLSATANAVNAGKSLPAVMAAGAKEGAILGGLHGAGSGEGLEGRGTSAMTGGATGLAAGALAPAAVAGASAVVKPVIAPVMARLRPDEYAATAIGEGLERSGSSIDDVVRALIGARAAGQDTFMVADAMGNAGERMLSTAARNPHNERQAVVEALIGRQMDQGRRVAGALGDASGSVMSAQRFQDLAKASRATDANINYAPVARETAPIDVSPAVDAANRAISPVADNIAAATGAVPTDLAARAGIEAGEAAIRDPIRNALKEARSYLAADSLTVTNVEKAFRAKTNIDMMIAKAVENGQGAMAEALGPVRQQLDEALARTSPQYARARDAYAAASQPIDAVDLGRAMSSPRNRTEDTIRGFGRLTPEQQHAARIGYFDPMIAKAESAAGTMTNSARPFLSDSMRRELPALAAPGQADILTGRLAREARMSETAAAALGGSKTADNLADAAEMAKLDPGIMTSLMRGRPIEAVVAALSKGRNEAKGLPPRVIERVARVMIETDPDAARKALEVATTKTDRDRGVRAVANAILANLSGSTTGRLAAP
jgi:hypothetical protein